MKPTQFGGIIDHHTFGRFEVVRKTLQAKRFADRLEKPLAYWALPNDRQLPIAFLRRTVGDLLSTPIDKLTGTPGIGQKKLRTFVTLLERASDDHPPESDSNGHDRHHGIPNGNGNGHTHMNGHFDTANVSEATWAQWQKNIVNFGLASETLGRLAPTLQSLPTVIWQTPLSAYLDQTLEEIRGLKTHGEKRVRGVVEVFYQVNKSLAGNDPNNCLAVRLKPKFAVSIEDWIASSEVSGNYTLNEIKQRLARPLLDQIRVDAGDLAHHLAEGRLGIDRDPQPVREQARDVGMTRARVYQILDECEKVMDVRWPDGSTHMEQLRQSMRQHHANGPEFTFMESVGEFFFASKPVEEDHRKRIIRQLESSTH